MSADPNSIPPRPRAADSPSSPRADEPMAAGQLVHKREFVEFVGRLDAVMRSAAVPVKRKTVLTRRAKLVLAAVLMLTLAMVKGTVWAWWSNYGPIPNELLGAWQTSSERFGDRGFVITGDSLHLRLGGGQSVRYKIEGMRRGRGLERNLFTVEYRDQSNLELQLGLYLKSDSVVYIANLPDVVWRKESR